MKARFACVGAVLIALAGLSVAVPAAAQVAPPANAEWILTTQLPSGGLAWYPDKLRIEPYFANFGVIGLADAYAATRDARYLNGAWAALSWYQSHMDANGYVTTYDVGPPPSYTETSTGVMDSTDGYAGLFLLALRQVYVVSGDIARLRTFSVGLGKAVDAVMSTQDSDGLTWALPTYHVKYLMDQSEAYAGLRAAAQTARVLGDSTLGARADSAAAALSTGLESMWDPQASPPAYHMAKYDTGNLEPIHWDILYPHALSQVWAVAVGRGLSPNAPLVDTGRAAGLMSAFVAKWPQWADPGVSGYWPMVGTGLMAVGRSSEALAGAAAIDAYAQGQSHNWPFQVAVAGEILIVNNDMPVARLSASPVAGKAALRVIFNGSISTANARKGLASYRLNFGDGSANAVGSGKPPSSVSHTYAAVRTYAPTLTVTDTMGLASSTTMSITATPKAGG